VELFVERARAIDGTFRLTDQNAPAISKICRVLDGLALAIEFAASRVAVLGTDALVGYLGQNLDLLDRSRRTAVPRHQKLRLTLDWSYRLLDKVEKHVLRRLSVFAGSFSLTAAQAIIGDGQASAAEVANALADLVDKSLVSADTAFDPVRFRLLNTTREYAAERLVEAGEVGILDRKHAAFYLEYLSEQADRTPNGSLSFLRNDLDNIRKALNWSFSDHGELAIGVPLAAASAGLFLDLALQAECAQWSSKALEKLPSRLHGTLDELHLRSNSALSQLFTQGNFPQVRSEIDRALTLARNLNDLNAKERIISGQFAFHLRGGDVPSMLETAREAEGLAQRHGDSLVGPAQSMMAAANAFAGNIEVAIPLAEGALDALPAVRKIGLLRTGVDQRIWAANSLAQTLWMSGSLDRANTVASETLREARAVGHPTPEAAALIWLIPISLWEGAYELARERVTRLMECSTRIGIASFRLAAEGHLGTLMLLEGKTDEGIARLEASASRLRGMNSKMLELGLLGNLAHGYRIAGQNHAASQKIDDALSLAKSGGTTIYIPELLRKRALIGWGETGDGQRLARNLDEALISARSVGSKMSELRTLVNFVEAERCIPERAKAARQELSNLHAKFQEGLGTADLRRAAEILVRTSDKCGSAIVFS
jgi:hypothetical protein